MLRVAQVAVLAASEPMHTLPAPRIRRNIRNTWNILLLMRALVFHVRALFRNIGFKRNIRDRSTCGMFRLFPLFRVLGISGEIPCPCVLEPRATVSPERVLTFA